MSTQDWNVVTFNSTKSTENNFDKREKEKQNSKYVPPEGSTKLEAPKKLGLSISQARTAKKITQKQLSADLGISALILSRWESNKEIPNNAQIAKIEKVVGIKLPRCKKSKIEGS